MNDVTHEETLRFMEQAFRNIDIHPFTPADVEDIRDALRGLVKARAEAAEAKLAEAVEALENIADRNKVGALSATADNPKLRLVIRDGFYAVMAREALNRIGESRNG